MDRMKFIKVYYLLVLLYLILSIGSYLLTLFGKGSIDISDAIIMGLYEFILFILSIIAFIKIKKAHYDKKLKTTPLLMIILWPSAYLFGIISAAFISESILLNPSSTFNISLAAFDFFTNIVILVFSIIAIKVVMSGKSKIESKDDIKSLSDEPIKRKKKAKIIVGIVLLVVIFLTVSTVLTVKRGMKMAADLELIVEQFVTDLQEGRNQEAYDLFSDLVKDEVSLDDLIELRENYPELYTGIVDVRYSGFETSKYNGTDYSGNLFVYKGEVEYDDGSKGMVIAKFFVNNSTWELFHINIKKSL